MVSPKRQSSLRRQGSNVRLSSNGHDLIDTKPLPRDDDRNGKSKLFKNSYNKSKLSASKWIVLVIAWCILTTIYFTSVVDNRSPIAARNLTLRGGGEAHSFATPIKHRRTLATTTEPDSEQSSENGDEMHLSAAPLSQSQDTEEDKIISSPEHPDDENDLKDSDPDEDSSLQQEQHDNNIPDDYVQSQDDHSSNEGDDESETTLEKEQHELAHDIANVVIDHKTPTSEESSSTTITANILEDEETIAMEISIESDAAQPACDLLPLNGGRYFWRNRQRLVDLDKKEICGPKVLIIGTKKCGTTNIADMLMRHPRVQINSCNLKNTMGGCREMWFQGALKQGRMFDGDDFTHKRRVIPNGWLDEFGKRLPSTDGINTMTIDKSPSYMDVSFFPDVAEYAKDHLPHAKIVATLCNPAERLYSEWKSLPWETHDGYKQLYWDNDVEPPTNFGEFVNYFHDESVCKEKEGFCTTNRNQYLKQGDFLHNLQPWYKAFGDENVLVVNMDDKPSDNVKKLLKHVGHALLPESEYPWDQVADAYATNVNEEYPGRGSSYLQWDDAMKWLEEYYAPQNEELAKNLGADWPLRWNCRLNGNCDQFQWES